MRHKINYLFKKTDQLLVTALALIVVAIFAIWWFDPAHLPHNFGLTSTLIDFLLFGLVSYVIWHSIIMEVLTWSIASHIQDIRQQKPVKGLKVAFITTIVPANESVDLLHKCLPAMVNTSYPHDTWVLDEGASDEVKRICDEYGVRYFTRYKKRLYNQLSGKFRKRTKGGNHNAWYDAYGKDYDIVAQIDTDFVPKKSFLVKTLGYFRDPKVAFVGTPQVYGNTETSFIAKGAAEQQYSFYGSVLRGLSGMETTLLIGANHVIRVEALKDVDLYSAHITEDLLTGMKLHHRGWKSIYVPFPLAIGEGPSTWEAYFNQQMRWAYGCIDILFRHSPRFFWKLGFRRTIYYFFLQQHYFSGLAMALSVFLLGLYFSTGIQAATIDARLFLLFYSVVLLTCWLMSVFMQRFDLHSHKKSELLLAGNIISIAAWPIYFVAFLCVIIRKRLQYKITPKGKDGTQTVVNWKIFIPHAFFFFIAFLGLISSFFTHRQSSIMLFWAMLSALMMLVIPFTNRIVTLKNRLAKMIESLENAFSFSDIPTGIEQQSLQGMKGGVSMHGVFRSNEKLHDILFLVGVVVFSLSLYVTKIGFYSDDWSFLGNFSIASSKSLWGLIQAATTPNTAMRPLQNVYDALLFWLFGYQPLGYQIVNGGVILFTIALFYIVLTKLKIPRVIAVSIPLLYALLPNYSTDKFWYAAFQTNTSILFYFLSLFAGLKAISKETQKNFYWKALSLFALISCGLSYEVALPLFLLNGAIYWYMNKRNKKIVSKTYQDHTAFITLNFICLFYLFVFKALTTTRLGNINFPKNPIHMITTAVTVNYISQIVTMPITLTKIITTYTDKTIVVFATLLFFVVYMYLYSLLNAHNNHFPPAKMMRNMTLLGVVAFLLGYAIFFTNNAVGFSARGIENRVAIAASIGVAITIIGGVGYLVKKLLPYEMAKIAYSLLIALVCSSGFIIISTLSLFWSNAYDTSKTVISAIHEQYATLPRHTTIMLDGLCPYVGPATVFESEFDVKGALQILYKDPTINGDIITPRFSVDAKGFHTNIYSFYASYPYNNLIIYNVKEKKFFPIAGETSAREYFTTYNPDYTNGCPAGEPGKGVSIF